MKRLPRLAPPQWKILSSAFSNMGQAIILFSFAAFFVPQTVSLPENFSRSFSFLTSLIGLSFLIVAVIMSGKDKK